MAELEWLTKLVTPEGATVSAVVAVISLILLKYQPALIKEFKETIQGIVTTHGETLKEERALYRDEMKELRGTFAAGLKDLTEGFQKQHDTLNGRIDGLREDVHELKTKLEK